MSKRKEIIAYKGFDKNLQCRGYQYKIGRRFNHKGKVEACESGFHACEYPLDVFGYYPPAESRFAVVKMSGDISREENGDTKIASASIKIEAEIGIPTLITDAVNWILDRCKKSDSSNETEDKTIATNTGDQSVATNTGNRSAASNTGNWSAATNTGYQSVATNTGYQSAASVSGKHSVAAATGYQSKAKASKTGAIVLVYRNDGGDLVHIRASKVGDNGIKPDTYYMLDENGDFQEIKQ